MDIEINASERKEFTTFCCKKKSIATEYTTLNTNK